METSTKRKLILVLIILFIIFLITGGLWFFARNRAIKNNSVPPTFKEFLGIGVSTRPDAPGPGGTTTSEFIDPVTGLPIVAPVVTPPTSQTTTIPVQTSTFTNSGYTPTGAPITPGTQGSSVPPTSTTIIPAPNTPGSVAVAPVAAAPECRDIDVSINFTPDEINRLNALKNRFYSVAESIRTDTDVATEIANYDSFKTKSLKIRELYNYCINSPVYTLARATPVSNSQPYGSIIPSPNAGINNRVPTPFWHDFAKDNDALIHQGRNFMGIFSETDPTFMERSIEHALRLNLW